MLGSSSLETFSDFLFSIFFFLRHAPKIGDTTLFCASGRLPLDLYCTTRIKKEKKAKLMNVSVIRLQMLTVTGAVCNVNGFLLCLAEQLCIRGTGFNQNTFSPVHALSRHPRPELC
jgi:hypothetical protein